MKTSDDITSPKTQRRLWRRVWIGFAVFVLLAPVLLWVAIDLGGKREWSEVQARLQAKGEATTVEELNLPSSDELVDADNFCSLPWLIAKADGSESAEMLELDRKLKIFRGSQEEPLLMAEAGGNPALGFSGDISALARTLDLAAEENEDFEFDAAAMDLAGDDPAARIGVYVEALDDFWQAAEAARERPQAYWLPLYEKRLAAKNGMPFAILNSGFSVANNLNRALLARMRGALQSGDYETVLRSLEIAQRLGEASGNEPSLIGGLVAQTGFAVCYSQIVRTLWTEAWQRDADKLRRMQSVIERWRLDDMMVRALRGELVSYVGMLHWLAENRSQADREGTGLSYGFGSGGGALFSLVPPGWLHSNAAYAADLMDRTLLDACRDGDYTDVLSANERMQSEIAGLNRMERAHRFLAVLSLGAYHGIFLRTAYTEACRRQALIACALYRYRLDHDGEFPSALDALVPAYLDAVPSDPIDGLPMRYAATEDGSFLLYSIGFDGYDDGGDLNLDSDRLERTRVRKTDYLGDWPWPVAPRAIEAAENGEK